MIDSTRITDSINKVSQRLKPLAPSLKDAECERVRENFKTIVRRAGDNIRDPQRDWPPLLLLERDGRIVTHCLDGYDVDSAQNKNYLAQVVLPAIIRDHEPRVAGVAFHCWTVSPLADRYLDVHAEEHGTIANHPSRTECLTLLVVDDDENVEGWVATVTRRHRRPPKLGPWTGGKPVDGRFAAPLQKAMAGQPARVSGLKVGPAKGTTMEFYRLLFERTLPEFGDDAVESALLLGRPDGVKGFAWSELNGFSAQDPDAASRLIVEEATGLKHLALVLGFPPGTEWSDPELRRLLSDQETVAITVADEVGISVATASIERDGGQPWADRWGYWADVPSGDPLVEFLDDLRQLVA